jgi:hypothetical protein
VVVPSGVGGPERGAAWHAATIARIESAAGVGDHLVRERTMTATVDLAAGFRNPAPWPRSGRLDLRFRLAERLGRVTPRWVLSEQLGAAFVSVSTPATFPAIVYWYSSAVDCFVPSGGSKWAIEAPSLLDATRARGVAPAKVVLAYAWGDMATDLIQPSWALPLLALAKLELKDVLGFLLVVTGVLLGLVSAAFLLLA